VANLSEPISLLDDSQSAEDWFGPESALDDSQSAEDQFEPESPQAIRSPSLLERMSLLIWTRER